MKCSVVILNWNGEKMLRRFLPIVLQNTEIEDVEIVVADNGSTDSSLEYLKTQDVRVIEFEKNYGFAEGYNRAINHIDSEYVVLLNSDIEVTPYWLDHMLEYMDTHPNILAIQPKILSWHSKQDVILGNVSDLRFEHAGAAGGMIDILGYPYCRGRIMSFVENDKGQYDDIVPIFWASGACLLTRTNIYKKMGGLDPIFFAHQEEIDFCWRLHNKYDSSSKNTPIITVYPQAVVYHVGGGTLGYESPRKTFLNFRNNLLMLYKNVPRKHLWWLMIIRFFMDYLAAIQMVVSKQKDNAKAVLQARYAFHRLKKQYHKNNISQFPLLVSKRSIVLDFYLLKKKV